MSENSGQSPMYTQPQLELRSSHWLTEPTLQNRPPKEYPEHKHPWDGAAIRGAYSQNRTSATT